MKRGANFKDQNLIKKYAEAGHDAAAISQSMRIDLDVVKNFMPKKAKAKPKAKPVVEESTDET